MWVKVLEGDQESPQLQLPYRLWRQLNLTATHLRFGAALLPVIVGPLASARTAAGGHPQAPAAITLSRRLIQALHLRTEPVYRVQISTEGVEIGPVLGLLLGNRNHWYDNGYLMREPERFLSVYARTGGLTVAFSPRNFSAGEGCAYGLWFDPGAVRWRYGRVPVPQVMHRRSFHSEPAAVARLRRATGVRLFNSYRNDKWELYQVLRQDPGFRRHLPHTVRVEQGDELLRMLEHHPDLILKPVDLSRGRGILFVTREGDRCRLVDYRAGGSPAEASLAPDELTAFARAELRGRRYICQERIDLALVDGSPFDIRVVMQRSPAGAWCCSGIECRLAGSGRLVTNLAFGGRALLMREAVQAAFADRFDPAVLEGEVIALAERFCHLMDLTREHFGEWGIDVALDRTGRTWYIEANVLPTFKGFLAIDPPAYRRILSAPLLYAASLTGFGPSGPGLDQADWELALNPIPEG